MVGRRKTPPANEALCFIPLSEGTGILGPIKCVGRSRIHAAAYALCIDSGLPESEPGYEDEEDMDFGMHHIDIGLHVGPSISINPVDHLKLSVYFRFVPSYSMLILNSELYQSFTPLFTYGGEISYKVIGIGIEGRSGNAKYTDMLAQIEGAESMKIKYHTSALRFYISFRF